MYLYSSKLLLLMLLLSFGSCSVQKLSKKGVYKELNPALYSNYVTDSLVYIIDVRTAKEYRKSHIKGAINVNYFAGNFKKHVSKLELDTEKTVLIYCETQHRSLMVANKIYKAGFKRIIDLDKGMRQWRKENYPFVSEIDTN